MEYKTRKFTIYAANLVIQGKEGKLMSMRDIFSKRLKALRKEIGISQEAFADALGVARATLGYYEKGERLPDIEFLDIVCEKTGCSMEYLMGRSDNMKPSFDKIGAETGLSDKAIEALMRIRTIGENRMLNLLIGHEQFSYLLIDMMKIIACSANDDPDFDSAEYIEYKYFRASKRIREICESSDFGLNVYQDLVRNEGRNLEHIDIELDSLMTEIKSRRVQQEKDDTERETIDPLFRFRRRMEKEE